MDQHPRGVDARLMREHVQPDARLGRLHWDPADTLEVARQLAQLVVLEVRDLDAEQVAQLHQHLVHGRVAGSLAYSVDARGEDLRPGAKGHDRVPGAEAE